MEELYAIYGITRVVLLLSNKYNKSSKVQLELSLEKDQAFWPNGLLCFATGNTLDSSLQTSFYLLRHQPAALQDAVPSSD